MSGNTAERGPPAEIALDAVLRRVGRLNYTWTNTESLLIHLIAGLARVDKDTAVVLFLTLNTTRARVDLVERLAKLHRVASGQRRDVLAATNRLMREGALRNKYNHCIYSFDPSRGQVQTIMMRIHDRKEDIRVGKTEAITPQEAANIDACITRLERLNGDIWKLVRQHGFPL